MVICFFGDSITLGYGDESGLGWPGYIIKRLMLDGRDLTAYNLGVRKDASPAIAKRWRTEAELRKIEGQPFKLIFSFGVADMAHAIEEDGTLEAARAILDKAKTVGEVLMVGPTPVADDAKNAVISAKSDALQQLCASLNVPFVPTFSAMRGSTDYARSITDNDNVHPGANGCAILAEYVLADPQAQSFFDSK